MNADNILGLYGKFYVSRVDGKDLPFGSKENAKYFVLDYENDPYARKALRAYANACRQEFPDLAADLYQELEAPYVRVKKEKTNE